ncbi:uncharacterized protein LY89DRAFT_404565 [Mollisia scopiformis]|uniref:Xylanolytic transcriptional activator regulatory domain-containing protein n=1 Tax=Mollisia scopiformis TaxID=149040 RepID=A0A132B2V0_MOLSC|nr:uncharacterized protein LY89DRAFT_404565 [Mollisia scopiformis]KUJ06725.1 hypothetical protein LY89DRAFT_404565 [Mollisia scopiformis]
MPTCTNCQRREDLETPCTYTTQTSSSKSSEREYIHHLQERIRQLESDRGEEKAALSSLARNHVEAPPPPPPSAEGLGGGATPGGPGSSSFHGQLGSVPSTLEYSFVLANLSSAEDQSQLPHDRDPEEQKVPSYSSPDQEEGGDTPVSAMGAASHISDRVTTAQELFYGNSSAVSFQHEVQETLRRPSGGEANLVRAQPSKVPQRKQPCHTLSSLLDQVSSSKLDALTLPPRPFADHLIDLYWNRVHCLYPFVHKPTFLKAYEQLWVRESAVENENDNSNPAVGLGGSNCGPSTFYCALNGIFALACQFSDLPSDERESLADTFFRRAKHFLHIDILDEGDLALVQTLLIMAQYLQSTHYPDRCWNIVGLACRVAQGIGLYLDDSTKNRATLEIEMRRRSWYGCVTLDTVVSMTLGRPPITSGQSDVPLPLAVNDDSLDSVSVATSLSNIQPPLLVFFGETIKLYKILSEILTGVYKLWSRLGGRNQIGQHLRDNAFDTIIKLDYALSDFESNIPNELHWTRRNRTHGTSEMVDRQVNVLHARFIHLKLLLYRPIFNQLCLESKLEGLTRTSGECESHDKATSMLYSHFAPRCAAECVGAAGQLIDIIDRASQTSATGAWWYNVFYLFSSAMVLVLAELCPTILDPGKAISVRHSWDQCQRALRRMSLHNDAAKQCAKTLCSMRQQMCASSNTQKSAWDSAMNNPQKSDPHPGIIDTSGHIAEQTILYKTGDGQGSVDNEFLFTDMQVRDMLSQSTGLQPPWNLDDIGWGNMLTQNY